MGWQDDPIASPTANPTAKQPWENDAVVSAPAGNAPNSPGLLAQGADWLKTRAINAATGFAGQARGAADLVEGVNQKFGMSPKMAKAALMLNPITAVGQYLPSTNALNQTVYDKGGVSQTNLPGTLGHAVDVGVETALQAPAFPGSIARNIIPAFVGGATQELAGHAVEGSPWEVPARVGTSVIAGGGTAGLQNLGGNAAKGVTNALGANARNVDTQAATILGRSLERDKTNFNALSESHSQLPEGTPLVVAAGPNTQGAVRGSTAAPGPARTAVAEASENYLTGGDKRTGDAITRNVSDQPPISTRTATLSQERSAAAGPAYEAAGIPRDRTQLGNADRLLMSDDLLGLFKDSPDVQAALRNARRVPELKNEPNNSMAVLDRVYKHIGGLEQAARRAGNGTRADDLADIRKRFAAGIDSEKPQYGEARAAFSEPSKLIDAATAGRDAFSKNLPADKVSASFKAMAPDQQQEFLGGVADFLRTRAGGSDRATAAERIWNNQNVRDRLKAILPEEKYAEFSKLMDQEKQGATVLRGINSGSRTVPMGLEAADNAGVTGNAFVNVMRGRPVSAALGVANALSGRVAEGRTQAVNERLAQWMMETDPEKIGLVRSLAERARLKEAQRGSNRMNALATGALLPTTGASR